MPRHAEVYTAHEYVSGDPTCPCSDADDHSPCAECGSGRDSYIHTEEGALAGALLTVVTAEDLGSASDDAG